MTSANNNQGTPDQGMHAGERILDHSRMQLSALMDGAMAPDEARFLLRRLQHDDELADCWTRWQLCGDVMRGRASALLPADFSRRVAAAIAADVAEPARRHVAASSWARWGGGAALAASVAVIALFVTRQLPDARAPVQAPTQVVAAATTPPVPAPVPAKPTPASPSAPDIADQFAAAVAVADVPRRAMRRSRGQSQRAAIRNSAARAPEVQVAVAATTPAQVNPFAPRAGATSRPWPRALLPNAPANGAFTVDYANAATSPSYYPFAPRTGSGERASTDDGSHAP